MYKRNSKIINNVLIYVILILGAIIMTFPFYYMFITSLKESAYIFFFTAPPTYTKTHDFSKLCHSLERGRFC